MLRTAMLDSIVQSFLQDPEQAKRSLFRYALREVFASKFDLDTLLAGKLPAEACGSRSQPQMLQVGGVEAVRQAMETAVILGAELFTIRTLGIVMDWPPDHVSAGARRCDRLDCDWPDVQLQRHLATGDQHRHDNCDFSDGISDPKYAESRYACDPAQIIGARAGNEGGRE